MLGKRPRGLQRSTSTSKVIEMVASKDRARPSAVKVPPHHYHEVPKDGLLNGNGSSNVQTKSPDKLVSPRSPLSVLQCLLTNYFIRKAEAEEPRTSVGLSIVIDNLNNADNNIVSPSCVSKMQILNKSMQVAAQCKEPGNFKQKTAPAASSLPSVPSPLPAIDFLDACYLCKKSLGPGKDIYMYRGDRAFCSVECRWQQILTDERNEKCSSAAIKAVTASPSRRSGGHGHGHRARGTGRIMATVG
ncbi:hypothetical protein SUGI_0135950 [Cryptomeria japonica]|uniref:uncharacterized protein LOC131044655 n=1 Tax=Cryptomeria japonica TaxID=3369 RepID=UPI002408EB14|nr:uncharacterized protein LOC131044655 [Cryptomeria japonica]GLJ10826.1 hypothetical protein SUGI_0135950 [Cryptomeria japonica]